MAGRGRDEENELLRAVFGDEGNEPLRVTLRRVDTDTAARESLSRTSFSSGIEVIAYFAEFYAAATDEGAGVRDDDDAGELEDMGLFALWEKRQPDTVQRSTCSVEEAFAIVDEWQSLHPQEAGSVGEFAGARLGTTTTPRRTAPPAWTRRYELAQNTINNTSVRFFSFFK